MGTIGRPITALLLAPLASLYALDIARGFDFGRGPAASHSDHWRRRRIQVNTRHEWRGRGDRPDGDIGAYVSDSARVARRGDDLDRDRVRDGGNDHRRRYRRARCCNVPGVNHKLPVPATGAGLLILSHVNDARLWLVKRIVNMSVVETFKTWTMMETIISVAAMILIMAISTFV
nr:hypothetical protein [Burkholderia diffusa]